MTKNNIDLLAIDRGTVTAPAGCGKTQLIAEALTRHVDRKPILVLTHTNAGVVALRGRLDRAGVSPKSYRLQTIDGWAMRLIATFPLRSRLEPALLGLANPRTDYPAIRGAAAQLLRSGDVADILAATYSRVIVDEYQDCSILQHEIVSSVSKTLSTCVLGDPMQAIFGFGGDDLARWEEDVCTEFPIVGELSTPWRWINASSQELGYWLLTVRGMLLRSEPIDLRNAPNVVRWIALDGSKDHVQRLEAARVQPRRVDGRVLIIGDSMKPDNQRQFASQTPGAVTIEAVDLRDFISFTEEFDVAAPDALTRLAEFAESVMTSVSAKNLIKRVQSLLKGTARNPPTSIEKDAIAFVQKPSYRAAADLLSAFTKKSSARVHRPSVLKACTKALNLCGSSAKLTLYDAAIQIREQNRLVGRPLPKRAVGSTLLLKGLEAEVVVVLNADVLDARNLYVAMTRGSEELVVCSRSAILNQ